MARVVILQGDRASPHQSDSATERTASEPGGTNSELRASEELRNRNIERGAIAPGGSAIIQLRLEEPLTAVPGDRFIIRSYSPQVTIGGGLILDALPEKHRIRDQLARMRLEQLETDDDMERVAVFVEMAGAVGATESELAARTGATDMQMNAITRELIRTGRVLEVTGAPLLLISENNYRQLAGRVTDLLSQQHSLEPLSLGVSREEVRDRVFGQVRPEIFRSVVARLVDEGKITAERDVLRLSSHRPALTPLDEAAKKALEGWFKSAGLQAATLEESAAATGTKMELARKLYNLLTAERRVIRIAEFVFHVDTIEDLKMRIRTRKSINPKIDVSIFKELTGGLTRKYAIPLLEYLDREHITRRVGNEREIL
jgi:selenocysteine-specific elongation factor